MKKRSSKLRLADVPSDLLWAAAEHMHGEVAACDEGVCPEHRHVFVALFNAAMDEMKARGVKPKKLRKLKLPKWPKEEKT